MAASHLAEHLKALREFYGYTQEQISSMLNIERSAYANYEAGKRIPSLDILIAIADLYQVSLDDLVRNPAFDPASASFASPDSSLSVNEIVLLRIYRSLSPQAQREYLEYILFQRSLTDD